MKFHNYNGKWMLWIHKPWKIKVTDTTSSSFSLKVKEAMRINWRKLPVSFLDDIIPT